MYGVIVFFLKKNVTMKLYTLIYLFNAQKNVGVLVVCTFLVGSLVGYYVHHHNISCIINSLVSAFVRKLPKKD